MTYSIGDLVEYNIYKDSICIVRNIYTSFTGEEFYDILVIISENNYLFDKRIRANKRFISDINKENIKYKIFENIIKNYNFDICNMDGGNVYNRIIDYKNSRFGLAITVRVCEIMEKNNYNNVQKIVTLFNKKYYNVRIYKK